MQPTRPIDRTIHPGMSNVIYPGEQLVIRDSDGEEIAVSSRDDAAVMIFLRAFDDLRLARLNYSSASPVMATLEREVERAFVALPERIKRELPSRTMVPRLHV